MANKYKNNEKIKNAPVKVAEQIQIVVKSELNDENENILYLFYPKSSKCLVYDIQTKKAKITLFEQNEYCNRIGIAKIKNKIYTTGGYKNNKFRECTKLCASYEIFKRLKFNKNRVILIE